MGQTCFRRISSAPHEDYLGEKSRCGVVAEPVVMEEDPGSSHSPLVSVSFQKNEERKFKFLEGEPKALGITQICLSVFHISCIAVLFGKNLLTTGLEIPSFIFSIFICIAGSLAIAAKKLHLPTIRACLGMELVACVSAITLLAFNIIKMLEHETYCYRYTGPGREACHSTESGHLHLFAELVLIEVALFAISVTLVVYASKVAHCCSPAPKVPVITIQAQPASR